MLINICQAINWLNAPHFPSLVCGNAQEIVTEKNSLSLQKHKKRANRRLNFIFT